jgi:putative oxidoreductase
MRIDTSIGASPKRKKLDDRATMAVRLLELSWIPHGVDSALLVLRVWMGTSLFLKHGLGKLFGYSEMVISFPDPLHIGAHASLVISLVSDGICSILIILGLATRWSALIIFVNIFVAWATVVHFQFFGRAATAGELICLYLGGFLSIFWPDPDASAWIRLYETDGRPSEGDLTNPWSSTTDFVKLCA